MERSKRPLELYIHIPFCVRKCNYCDFLSGPGDESTKRAYVEALCSEIKNYGYLKEDYKITSVFIGGGTPSILPAEAIVRIMNTVREAFSYERVSFCDEITIECNPGTLDAGKVETYMACGINRISLGLQSAVNEELKRLGRIHTYEDFEESYNECRNAGCKNINIDIMTALPGQTAESCEKTLEAVTALEPDHISAYSLIIEEGTEFFKHYSDGKGLPSEDEERLMYEMTEKHLAQKGYIHYEISNYAKKGCECRHNLGYWRRIEYLGVGLGASSLINNSRFHNETNIKVYIENWNTLQLELRRDESVLSIKEQMEEFMFLGLRITDGISTDEFEKVFGKEYNDVYGKVTASLTDKKLIETGSNRIWLTSYGRDVSNVVLAEFLLD